MPLNDRESMIKLLKENGFEIEFCWTETLAYDIYEKEGLDKILKQPRIAKIIEESGEKKIQILSEVENIFNQMKSNKTPLTAEIVYITARKP
mgnify:CR=1 FL=1|jgi:hypothetical protein